MKVVLYGSPVVAFENNLRQRVSDDFDLVAIDYGAGSENMIAAFGDASAVVTVRFDQDIPPAPNLALVQVPGVGCDEIDLAALPPTATLCNVYGHAEAVAEFAILALLQWCHRFCEANASFKSGSWERSSRFGTPPHGELFGRVVGLVGYGHVGRAIAKRLAGFGVTTLVCNRTPPSDIPNVAKTYELRELPNMLEECDFIIVSVALTEETSGLLGPSSFASMKKRAVLINVARGPIVDEEALYLALSKNRIGGAVIDVWYNYPESTVDAFAKPSKFVFSELSNVYMTPHISGWTQGTVERRWSEIADNLERLRANRPLLNIVQERRRGKGSKKVKKPIDRSR